MPTTNNIKKLFTISGCISPEGMQRYVSGTLTAAEKELIDAHLGTCELCTDALGGFQQHNNPAKVALAVTDINRQLHQKFLRIQTKKMRERSMVSVFSAAATIILITGLFYLMKQREIYRERLLAYSLQDSITISDRTIGQLKNDMNVNESAKISGKAESGENTVTMPHPSKESNVYFKSKQPEDESKATLSYESAEELRIVSNESPPDTLHVAEARKQEDDFSVAGYAVKSATRDKKESLQAIPANAEGDNAVSGEVFMIAEEMPVFMGGDINKFREYIQQQLKYPVKAAEAGIEGKVFVSFIINEKGKLVNPKIVRSADPLLDKEALRVISSSPAWTPGMMNGKPVSVQLVIPVIFQLKKE